MSSDVHHLRQSFINGDHDMMLDLQGLLHEKSPQLSWKDSSALHTAHRSQSASAAAQVTVNNSIVSVDATMLEHSESALFRQKFEYDLALMEVYRSKVRAPKPHSCTTTVWNTSNEGACRPWRQWAACSSMDAPPPLLRSTSQTVLATQWDSSKSLRGNTSRREHPPKTRNSRVWWC